MTRVLLVSLSGYPQVPSNFMPDNGLAGLAALLKRLGHEALILDYNSPETMRRLFPAEFREKLAPYRVRLTDGERFGAQDFAALEPITKALEQHRLKEYARIGAEIADLIVTQHFDLLGLKVWNGEGYHASKLISEQVKQRIPSVPIIAGGPHADYFGEYLLQRTPTFDYVAVAEGEELLPYFLAYLSGREKVENVPNLIYRHGGEERFSNVQRVADLNSLPLGVYDTDVYPAMRGNTKAHIGVYEESRGCPMKCSFCAHPVKAGDRLRKRDVNLVLSDLKALRERYGFCAYKFGGSYTPTNYLEKLCQGLLAENLPISFVTYGHINDSRRVDFDLLHRAGCHALFFGVESGSELLLREKTGKQHTYETTVDVLMRAKRAGILTVTSIIYPNCGETPESRATTLKLLKEVHPDSVPCHWPFLIPNTPWSREPEKFGFTLPSREEYLDNFLTYQVRLMFPPSYWKPLAYKLDGKSFSEFAQENSDFLAELESSQILTLVSDDTTLMAKFAGRTPREFRDLNRTAFFCGDVETVEGYVATINQEVRTQVEASLRAETSRTALRPEVTVVNE